MSVGSLGFHSTERLARRDHQCTDCSRTIRVGERYREVVASPRYDFNPRPGHWTRGYFCIRAAEEGR